MAIESAVPQWFRLSCPICYIYGTELLGEYKPKRGFWGAFLLDSSTEGSRMLLWGTGVFKKMVRCATGSIVEGSRTSITDNKLRKRACQKRYRKPYCRYNK